MASTNSSNHKIISFFGLIFGIAILAVVIIPPMVSLNYLKPKIENIIFSKTGVPAKINGDINFSLIGPAVIIAHDITVPNGIISSCKFTIPFWDIFDLKNANVFGDIYVTGASLVIDKIIPFNRENTITVRDSTIKFLNKEYNIVNAKLSKGDVNAIVRTDQHKYEVKSRNNLFIIKNRNNDLSISGELFDDGSATAHIDIVAQNINKWFQFEYPKITTQFPVSADIFWDGKYGVKFTNIQANRMTGSITLHEDGRTIVKLRSDAADYDLSFFLKSPAVFQNASFDVELHGNIKFADNNFKHVKIVTVGTDNEIKVDTIIADDLKIHGGTIDKNGGHNLHVNVPYYGEQTTCLFNGSQTDWRCDNFSYGGTSYGGAVTGTLKINTEHFEADLTSPQPFHDFNTVIKMAHKLGTNGYVKFDCPDMKGILTLTDSKPSVSYSRLNMKTLDWAKIDLPFIPDFMRNEPGDFIWTKDSMIYTPDSKTWQLSIAKDFFIVHGDNFKSWFPNTDLQSLRDLPYTLSGNYKNGNISNLILEIGGQKFTGTLTNNLLTLKTDILNIDLLTDPYFINNFEELSFFTQLPIMIPFDLNANLAISADTLIYNYKKYDNFVYSLHDNTETFSISDSKIGNMLATIKKNNIKYTINIQLNKFVFDKQLLPQNMPLNLSNTVVTADIKLNTSGKIAHDIINNLKGTFDASFYGGKLYGFGFDKFYASANRLTLLNSETFLSEALTGGITSIKKMHIIGTYENGDIKTTQPLKLSMPHVDASGNMEIQNNEIKADLNLILRGTSSGAEPINITIHPNNHRDFSLSEIMMHFDAEYMKSFVKSHDKF